MVGKIGDVFGWAGNPIYQTLASNKHTLMNLGAGLASGNSWSDGLSRAFNAVPSGAAADDAYAVVQEEKAKQQDTLNQTTEWLRQNGQTQLLAAVESGALSPSDAWQMALKPQEGIKPIEINGQLVDPTTGAVLGDYRDPTARNGGAEVSLQPTWLIGPDGQPVFGQATKAGEIIPSNLPEGYQVMDPRTLAGERSFGTAFGTAGANNQNLLPDVVAKGEQFISNLDGLLYQTDANGQVMVDQSGNPIPNAGKKEQFGRTFNIPTGQIAPAFPGTEKRNFQERLSQVGGQAFLQGIQQMAGTGAISEAEGSKATSAVLRASAATTEDAFDTAINEAKRIVAQGLERARRKAAAIPSGYGGQTNFGTQAVQPAGGTTSSGLSWSASP